MKLLNRFFILKKYFCCKMFTLESKTDLFPFQIPGSNITYIGRGQIPLTNHLVSDNLSHEIVQFTGSISRSTIHP